MRIRFIAGEIMRALRTNVSLVISLIIVTAVSLTFVGAGALMQKEIRELKSTLVEQSQVSVFLCSAHSVAASCAGGAATPTQIAQVREALNGPILKPYIASVHERDQKEALAIYRTQFSGQDIAANVTEKDMPVSFHLTLRDESKSDVIRQFFEGRDGVDEVNDLLSVYEPFIRVLNQSTLFAGGIAALMLIAAVLLVSTTIRMSVGARTREIAVMRLVGASNLVIRLPFLLEGAVAAVIGALISSGLLWVAVKYLVEGWLSTVLDARIVRVSTADLLWITPALVVIGIIMSVAASVVSLNRHLKV